MSTQGMDLLLLQFSITISNSQNSFFYNSNVLSDCKQTDTGFKCTCTIESAWFKIINAEAAKEFVTSCDPVFYKKYGDVTYILTLIYLFVESITVIKMEMIHL